MKGLGLRGNLEYAGGAWAGLSPPRRDPRGERLWFVWGRERDYGRPEGGSGFPCLLGACEPEAALLRKRAFCRGQGSARGGGGGAGCAETRPRALPDQSRRPPSRAWWWWWWWRWRVRGDGDAATRRHGNPEGPRRPPKIYSAARKPSPPQRDGPKKTTGGARSARAP